MSGDCVDETTCGRSSAVLEGDDVVVSAPSSQEPALSSSVWQAIDRRSVVAV